MKRTIAAALAVTLTAGVASAHKPDFGEGEFAGPATAYQITDPAVSIVVYRNVTCERPELWMELQAEAGLPLFVQLLTPVIDRLENYRPNLAIVGPGLPRQSIGIDLPSGSGAILFNTRNVQPEIFDERFTGTRDWVLVEETVTLPQSGKYYVVAWDPNHMTGKLAVAVGTVEEFGLGDIFRFPGWRSNARAFHELGRDAPATPIVEQSCR